MRLNFLGEAGLDFFAAPEWLQAEEQFAEVAHGRTNEIPSTPRARRSEPRSQSINFSSVVSARFSVASGSMMVHAFTRRGAPRSDPPSSRGARGLGTRRARRARAWRVR